MDDRMSDKPLGRLLLEGLGEIAWIAVLVALGVLLPLPLVALGWALLLGAEWAMDRWRGKVPYRLQQALFFWVLGGGIALGQALPGFWLGLGGGLLAVIGGVLLQIRFERGLRLERQAPQALDVPLPAEVAPGAAKRLSEPPRARRSACSTAARSPWAARWYATT